MLAAARLIYRPAGLKKRLGGVVSWRRRHDPPKKGEKGGKGEKGERGEEGGKG